VAGRSFTRASWLAYSRTVFEEDFGPQGEIALTLANDRGQELRYRLPVPPAGCQSLTPLQADVLTALGQQTLSARELAARSGYALNTYFRRMLTDLRRRGLIEHTGNGWRRLPPGGR
jgi:hypothetical protein